MTGARRDEFLLLGSGGGFGRILDGQEFFPVGPIAIFDAHGDGCTDGLPVMDAGENLRAILLDFLAAAAAIAELATVQFVIDSGEVNGQTGGEAGDEGEQGLSVGFTGGVETEHGRDSLSRNWKIFEK
jgi:hypothetical protein